MVKPFCNTFWSSHGCDLEPGHEGDHVCIIGFEMSNGERYEEVCCTNDGKVVTHQSGSSYEQEVFSI